MVRDAYANYVVQTTLDVVPESDEKKWLLAELSAHADELVSVANDELTACLHDASQLPPVGLHLTLDLGLSFLPAAPIYLRKAYSCEIGNYDQ